MSLPVIFRPVAQMELDDALAWYKRQRDGLEQEFMAVVDQLLARISATPLRFAPVRGDIRRALLPCFPYASHFVPEQNGIIVLAVFHVRRDPRHLEGRS